MAGAEDRELVQRAQSGDRTALDTLLRRHYDRIYAICRRIAGNDADAADAAQEALMAIVRGLVRFDGRSAFSTWSYRVATNACLDELRRRKRRPTPTDTDESADWSVQTADPESSSFDDRLVEREAMSTALDELPEDFREPVLLRDCAGLDYAEISEVLGIPPGTVRSRIARGRAKLAEIVQAGNQAALDERPMDQP
ncbi:MAG: RNA polymerase sigma factor [Actinomycetota bacterium]